MAQRVPPVALCIMHAEPELTARPWFRVLNSHQGQSAYSGLVAVLATGGTLCAICPKLDILLHLVIRHA